MKKLTSNTEFGFYLRTLELNPYKYSELRDNFDVFLSQILEIWMFIPCKLVNGIWVVLEPPKRWNDYLEFPESFDGNKEWYDFYEYEEAKERCLFEGFILDTFGYINHKESKISYDLKNNLIIEDIVQSEPILTLAAQKQIGSNQ